MIDVPANMQLIQPATKNVKFHRLNQFRDRGFGCTVNVNGEVDIFSIRVQHPQLGQAFTFYFSNHVELTLWALGEPQKPRRIVRSFINTARYRKNYDMDPNSADVALLQLLTQKMTEMAEEDKPTIEFGRFVELTEG